MKKLQKILSLCLLLCMLLGVMPVAALAAEATPIEPVSDTRVNPLHSHESSEFAEADSEDQSRTYLAAGSVSYGSIQQAGEALRTQMMNRAGTISVGVQTNYLDPDAIFDGVWDVAIAHTGYPKAGDYLYWHWDAYDAQMEGYVQYGTYYLTLTYNMTYLTTASQERTMDSTVASLLSRLNLYGKSDYEKVKGVYDYICANITYDYANLNNDAYTLKYSAYAALINKTAVCQGYASLLYRLALELGVDCRVIAGLGNGEPHGWNIIRLNNLYYNADSTWDASRTNYAYFLTSDANFPGHYRDDEYRTSAFYAAYPMSAKNYCNHNYVGGVCTICGEERQFTDVRPADYYYNAVKWAVENDITAGTSDTTFGPNLECTRGQVVTFLWRMAGKPVVSASNPFVDVRSTDYYYNAVRWAVSKGITAGVGGNAFAPDQVVTREQFVTFLYRYAGKPSAATSSSFWDVDYRAYYANAINWAYANGIVYGYNNGAFGVGDSCLRGQTVTFLYRYAN